MSIGSTLPSTLHAASTHVRSIAPQAQHVRTSNKTSKHSTCGVRKGPPATLTRKASDIRAAPPIQPLAPTPAKSRTVSTRD
eukprot:7387760-Prymnesium_polylepis.1